MCTDLESHFEHLKRCVCVCVCVCVFNFLQDFSSSSFSDYHYLHHHINTVSVGTTITSLLNISISIDPTTISTFIMSSTVCSLIQPLFIKYLKFCSNCTVQSCHDWYYYYYFYHHHYPLDAYSLCYDPFYL